MKAFRNYLVISTLLLGFLSFYIPSRLQISYPREIGPQFDTHIRATYIRMFNEQRPELFLFGDSMVEPDIDDKVVENRLRKRTLLASQNGSASTIWYLIIKNNIVVAEHKPQYIVLFFRDAMMTTPGYRVTGKYFEQVDEFASPDDKLLIERAYINQMTLPEKIMERYVPLYGSRWEIRQSIDYYIRYSSGRFSLDCDSACVDHAMGTVFKANNFDLKFLSDVIAASDDYMYTSDHLDFKRQIGRSLLPEIIRLCKENDIQLILVRTPILRFEEPGTEPPGLHAYIQDLTRYLEENKIPFLDFDQKNFSSEYFSDTLHLNEQGEKIFTEKLIKALETIIR